MKPDLLAIAFHKANSFPGTQPPNSAELIGSRKVGDRTYTYFQDDRDQLWYISDKQLEFEYEMQAAVKRQKEKH